MLRFDASYPGSVLLIINAEYIRGPLWFFLITLLLVRYSLAGPPGLLLIDPQKKPKYNDWPLCRSGVLLFLK
ncbi:hypothetical protein I7I50_05537 [Histoplasma capsulatum G186AR]|uniref:Uncharacterized protein n=1 Tax=Ajellomyces capsulatus TaxID=5037 RepID=A0A8H7Z742_AJECA|nr:hypothetical protein I7I52_03798 [Histoplasma capsulatum]QSS76172.1 hypothetical protein I7I50_05537 [Histoplasma capsulatum G186AR]